MSLDGASQAASFDEAKMNHLSQLSPEERAEIAFIMDAEMFQAVKDMRKHGLTLPSIIRTLTIRPDRRSPTSKLRTSGKRTGAGN